MVVFWGWAFWACIVLPNHAGVGLEYRSPPADQGGAIARAQDRQVHILSFNTFLRQAFATDEETRAVDDYKNERLEGILKQLERFDVVAVQEVWCVMGEWRIRHFISSAERQGFYHWYRSPCYPWTGKLQSGMLLILSRHPLNMVDDIVYEACFREDCLASKGALMARVAPFGSSPCAFDLIDTHLNAPGGLPTKEAQVVQLASFISARASSQGTPEMVFVMGDMNIVYNSSMHRQAILQHLPDFQDVLELSGREAQGTSIGGVIVENPRAAADQQGRLDYILVRAASEAVLDARVVPGSPQVELFETTQGEPYTTLSDHAGVAVMMQC